jgi:hypothetical protein
LRDFPNNILKRYGVAAVHPDVFCESIIVKNRSVAAEAFAAQINALKSPALNREQVLDGLSKVGMKKTVALLR